MKITASSPMAVVLLGPVALFCALVLTCFFYEFHSFDESLMTVRSFDGRLVILLVMLLVATMGSLVASTLTIIALLKFELE